MRLSSNGALAFFDLPWTPIYLLILFLFHPLLGWLSLAGAPTQDCTPEAISPLPADLAALVDPARFAARARRRASIWP